MWGVGQKATDTMYYPTLSLTSPRVLNHKYGLRHFVASDLLKRRSLKHFETGIKTTNLGIRWRRMAPQSAARTMHNQPYAVSGIVLRHPKLVSSNMPR